MGLLFVQHADRFDLWAEKRSPGLMAKMELDRFDRDLRDLNNGTGA